MIHYTHTGGGVPAYLRACVPACLRACVRACIFVEAHRPENYCYMHPASLSYFSKHHHYNRIICFDASSNARVSAQNCISAYTHRLLSSLTFFSEGSIQGQSLLSLVATLLDKKPATVSTTR